MLWLSIVGLCVVLVRPSVFVLHSIVALPLNIVMAIFWPKISFSLLLWREGYFRSARNEDRYFIAFNIA